MKVKLKIEFKDYILRRLFNISIGKSNCFFITIFYTFQKRPARKYLSEFKLIELIDTYNRIFKLKREVWNQRLNLTSVPEY